MKKKILLMVGLLVLTSCNNDYIKFLAPGKGENCGIEDFYFDLSTKIKQKEEANIDIILAHSDDYDKGPIYRSNNIVPLDFETYHFVLERKILTDHTYTIYDPGTVYLDLNDFENSYYLLKFRLTEDFFGIDKETTNYFKLTDHFLVKEDMPEYGYISYGVRLMDDKGNLFDGLQYGWGGTSGRTHILYKRKGTSITFGFSDFDPNYNLV